MKRCSEGKNIDFLDFNAYFENSVSGYELLWPFVVSMIIIFCMARMQYIFLNSISNESLLYDFNVYACLLAKCKYALKDLNSWFFLVFYSSVEFFLVL